VYSKLKTVKEKTLIFGSLDLSTTLLADPPEDFDGYIEVLQTGAWKGHWQGEFEITEAMLDQAVTYGNSRKNATPFEYGHDSFMGNGTRAIAAGWVEPGNLELRKVDGIPKLFVKPDFTAKALAHIQAKEYRYVSAEFRFNTIDRVTGKWGGASLRSIALTIHPFMEELGEIRANSDDAGRLFTGNPYQEHNNMDKNALIALLGLSENASDDDVKNAIKNHVALSAAIPGDDKAASLAEIKAKALSADATTSRLAALEAAEQVREQERKDALALSAVKAAQKEGKILGDDTEHFKAHLDLAKQDPERFAALSATMPRVTPVGDGTPTPKTAPKVDLDDTQAEINRQLGLSTEVFNKHNRVTA